MKNGPVNSYRDLHVWQTAMTLAEGCYLATRGFPREEMFGLTSQIRRSAVSVAANIAEGYGRQNRGSYIQFLKMAQGSLKELETHFILCERVGVSKAGATEALLRRCDDVGRMLQALIRSLNRNRDGDKP